MEWSLTKLLKTCSRCLCMFCAHWFTYTIIQENLWRPKPNPHDSQHKTYQLPYFLIHLLHQPVGDDQTLYLQRLHKAGPDPGCALSGSVSCNEDELRQWNKTRGSVFLCECRRSVMQSMVRWDQWCWSVCKATSLSDARSLWLRWFGGC